MYTKKIYISRQFIFDFLGFRKVNDFFPGEAKFQVVLGVAGTHTIADCLTDAGCAMKFIFACWCCFWVVIHNHVGQCDV